MMGRLWEKWHAEPPYGVIREQGEGVKISREQGKCKEFTREQGD